MLGIRGISKRVLEALKQSPMARNCDNWLYYSICKEVLAETKIDIDTLSFTDALLKRNALNLPPFESVRRSRQKLQAQYPELAADAEVVAMRELLENEYREFAIRG